MGKDQFSIKQQLSVIEKDKHVHFVYDSSLPLQQPYTGPELKGLELAEALAALFDHTNIAWSVRGQYIILTLKERHTVSNKPKPPVQYTLSGYITDEHGEVLINATIYDKHTGTGTMSNEYGFYSLTLPAGPHDIRISYIGFSDEIRNIELHRNRQLSATLKENTRLSEIVVTGDLNSPLLTTQTGKRSFGRRDFQSEFSLLSSPDVVKTLQRVSGVAEGVEIASGLYVHGGNNDENLFLLDSSPLYHTNHTLGLFSAFNTDIVNNVAFYKSGFPARYGGRLSSVIDVRTNEGNMEKLHGAASIGLIDGRLQLEGPIKKGKSSFNIGIRRSWLDLISRPVFAIINHKKDDNKVTANYIFHDINAKVTHKFNDRSKISLSLYSGRDMLRLNNTTFSGIMTDWDREISKSKLTWGNFNATVGWKYQFSPKLFANFMGVYSYNRSNYTYSNDDRIFFSDHSIADISHTEHGYKSTIYDLGYRTEFDYRPNPTHHIRFGNDFTYHIFQPQTYRRLDYYGYNERDLDSVRVSSHNHLHALERNAYIEDEMTINDHLSLNAGIHLDLFSIASKTYFNIDPRLAFKYQLNNHLSMKLSWTSMSQFVHKISNTYLDMPTDYWVPTTRSLKPMRAHQFAAGVYTQLNRNWTASLEACYKSSNNLVRYASWMGLEPPAASWDKNIMQGKGRYYGFSVDLGYKNKDLKIDAAYTLSWNKRKFDEFYSGWYYDKFDNRHRFNITGQYHLARNIYCFAAWTVHSGNRVTIPTQYVNLPEVPDNIDNGIIQYYLDMGDNTADFGYIYDHPHNQSLPLYHRLDVGVDFHRLTKKKHERIWNISIYNVYCHLNPLYVKIKVTKEGQFTAEPKGFIPILPSISYTYKF
uniref:TonB-dependent receptor n=1 Tax=Prevotella sp. GTC17262 TaxID=3236797 RepID=A0AB33JJ57_9BACT